MTQPEDATRSPAARLERAEAILQPIMRDLADKFRDDPEAQVILASVEIYVQLEENGLEIPVPYQPEDTFVLALQTASGGVYTDFLPESQLCPRQAPSVRGRWGAGYYWQCVKPQYFQRDYYNTAGYTHSLLILR